MDGWRVVVRADERVRTLGAVLAATDWPERERRLGLVKAHTVAAHAIDWLAGHRRHPCALALTALLDARVPPDALFAYVLGLSGSLQPEERATGLLRAPVAELEGDELAGFLASFWRDAQLPRLWEQTHEHWERATHDARAVLAHEHVSDFLALLFDMRRQPVFVPNLLFPALSAMGVAARGEAVCICPPPEAVGESRPWEYRDDPEWTLMATFRECCRATLRGLAWSRPVDAATIDLLSAAATALFLRASDDAPGARALVLMETKRRGLVRLPAVVAALEAYLMARHADRRTDVLAGLHRVLATCLEAA
jgi:hypothetical protein